MMSMQGRSRYEYQVPYEQYEYCTVLGLEP